MDNRRTDNRIQARFESLYSAEQTEGMGTLVDISYSGALIEGSDRKPELGKPIRIFIFIQPVSPLELAGTVVRHTEEGFAVEYPEVGDEIRDLVDDAAAIVNVRPRP
jgi:hypothetical protein